MRVAAIDCGTNSIRLLVAEVTRGPDGGVTLTDVTREMRIVRLGQGVDRTGRLAPEAIERTRQALADYTATIARLGADRVRMVATSATRDAANRDDFTAMVQQTLGSEPEVITGQQEAGLSFAGATGSLAGEAEPVLVLDIGGGSSELVLGSPTGSRSLSAWSMNVGAVRLTERHLHDDPPTAAQIEAAAADTRAALDEAQRSVAFRETASLVGVAGTITTVAALALGLTRYDSDRIHGTVLSAEQIEQVTGELLTMTHDERAAHAVIHPGRVDVIAAGALVLQTVLRRIGVTRLTVSERDILDGIARSLVD